MASLIVRSSSSRMTTPFMQDSIVIVYDAKKNRNNQEFKDIITEVLKQEEIFQKSSTITLLGVLDKVLHPMGFHIQVGPKSFVGEHARAIKEEVSRKVDACVSMLKRSAEECESKGVEIKVKIVVGAPINHVLVEEIAALQATWAILDRQLRKDLRFYLKYVPCKVAHVLDNLSLAVLRPNYIEMSTNTMNHKLLYSLSKPVPLPPALAEESEKHSVTSPSVSPMISFGVPDSSKVLSPKPRSIEHIALLNDEAGSIPQQEISEMKKEADSVRTNYSEIQMEPDEFSSDTSAEEGTDAKSENEHDGSSKAEEPETQIDDTHVLRNGDKINMDMSSTGCSYSNIQTATDNFSCENYLGEGGFGLMYKGKLNEGQIIAVKVRREAIMQNFAEFHSEISALSFARHTNIVTLLGYCFMENLNILIYEYISNKSLEWHLLDDTTRVLEWNQRRDIAIGTAKGLRFLHEECRGGPFIHRDIRPSNIFLTHEFVPLLGDCGLAKWKMYKFDKQRRMICNLVYLAPECAENGSCSIKTDVYAFGILLIQLISGRKAVDSAREDHQQSIRQWALPLIQRLMLCDLVDPRIGDTYCSYDLYKMAKAAYLCVQTKPSSRPTMGEVLCLLEGTNDNLRYVNSNLYPMITSTDS